MMFYHNFRIHHLLVALLLLAGCDSLGSSGGGDNGKVSKTQDSAPRFSGPDVAVFTAGSSQTVDYFCESPDRSELDVAVYQFPAGARYDITSLAGNYRKKISVTWSPGYGTEGKLHAITLLARTKAGGVESLGNFDIYVDAN